MNHIIRLTVVYEGQSVILTDCISLRYEKERYTPYSVLTGKWYCKPDIRFAEIMAVILDIDGVTVHYGYPDGIELEKKDGRNVLKVSSKGYSSALLTNQCADKMITDVNLQSLVALGPEIPYVSYEQNTPTVNYVNYYNGTSCWDAIVCYAMRATGVYPYLRGYKDICVSRISMPQSYTAVSDSLISRSCGSDYSNLISQICESDIDGTSEMYRMSNMPADMRMITRTRRISFDREWIMDPYTGLSYKLNYSCRKMSYDAFSFLGYTNLDLLDRFLVTDLGFNGEVDRLVVTASAEKGFVTNVWCYHDSFCM